jgi:hypothetical protein
MASPWSRTGLLTFHSMVDNTRAALSVREPLESQWAECVLEADHIPKFQAPEEKQCSS